MVSRPCRDLSLILSRRTRHDFCLGTRAVFPTASNGINQSYKDVTSEMLLTKMYYKTKDKITWDV